MQKIKSTLVELICLNFILFLFLLPLNSYASEEFYTVQTGSFIIIEPAQKQFEFLTQKLNDNWLSYLRVEKVEKFYTVRLGKYEDKAKAEQCLEEITPIFPQAMIIKAYVKDERIIKLYKKPPVVEKQRTEKKLLTHEKSLEEISKLVQNEDYEGAIYVIKEAMTTWPDSSELHGWYGATLLKMDLPEDAMKYFHEAAKLSENVPDYYNGLGYCLLHMDKANEAIDEFTKAINLDPVHIDALTGLGLAYANIGKKSHAMDVYEKLKDLDRDVADKLLKIIKKLT